MNLPEGTKFDDLKLRYDLLPPDALEEIVKVFTFGASKYEERNWEKGINYSRVFASSMRHLWAWFRGEDYDKETHLSHLAHAAVNCIFLLSYSLRRMSKFDNRPKTKKSIERVVK